MAIKSEVIGPARAGERVEVEARRVPFAEAFRFWVKLGFISFGGPAGQIAIMHRELVDRRRWLSEERFLHALNYCMLLPGPEAQQLAIYIGWLLHRTAGGIVAGAFFVIPSILILLALSFVYAAHGNVPAVAGVLSGFKPVVVAIVVEAVLKIGGKALKRRAHYALAAASFGAIYFLHVPFPLIVLAAAGIGLAGSRFWPGAFAAAPKTKEADKKTEGQGEVTDAVPLVIDDHAPPPQHTLPSRARALKVLAAGLVLWLIPMLALAGWRGWGSLHAQEYRFFTQSALVTFGGAYAVLAYVTQAAAGTYGWLTQAQAVDGLALAETTPGPLIMVLQFVGFMAGWNNPQGMDQTTSAVVGALVTTYATFLPCFIFIFLGAPYIEVLRGNKNLTGALTGITAAVVGVVLNLALVFGAAVIWPRGLAGGTDFFALYHLKADVLWVVLAGGALGLAWTLLGT
jgi:chromate transporter